MSLLSQLQCQYLGHVNLDIQLNLFKLLGFPVWYLSANIPNPLNALANNNQTITIVFERPHGGFITGCCTFLMHKSFQKSVLLMENDLING